MDVEILYIENVKYFIMYYNMYCTQCIMKTFHEYSINCHKRNPWKQVIGIPSTECTSHVSLHVHCNFMKTFTTYKS